MKSINATAIVLNRTDYGEADRILTLLTPDQGKLRVIAKGVRRAKSKLAGGIELFSVSDITFIRGRGELGTLVSSRLAKYYANIVKDIERTMLGYELIKRLNKVTEDEPEATYFELLEQAFVALDDAVIPFQLINVWFSAQLLRLAGHTPNLRSDSQGQNLNADKQYMFDPETAQLSEAENGTLAVQQIKFLRLLFNGNSPAVLTKVQGSAQLAAECSSLTDAMLHAHLRI